jgi:hypothetical protein
MEKTLKPVHSKAVEKEARKILWYSVVIAVIATIIVLLI